LQGGMTIEQVIAQIADSPAYFLEPHPGA
jgi:hypothetical protein